MLTSVTSPSFLLHWFGCSLNSPLSILTLKLSILSILSRTCKLGTGESSNSLLCQVSASKAKCLAPIQWSWAGRGLAVQTIEPSIKQEGLYIQKEGSYWLLTILSHQSLLDVANVGEKVAYCRNLKREKTQ